MTRSTLFSIAMLLASAGHPSGSPGQSTRADIERVLAAFDTALARNDTVALGRLLPPSFYWVSPLDGRVDTRATWMAKASAGLAVAGTNGNSSRSQHGQEVMLYGEPSPHTAVRVSRVRLLTPTTNSENWFAQAVTLTRDQGQWRIAFGQGTYLYSGVPQDAARLARYAGAYVIDSLRTLTLAWDGVSLLATYPDGTRGQVFLKSPTEQAVAVAGAGLHFTLGPDSVPVSVALVSGTRERWRGFRRVR